MTPTRESRTSAVRAGNGLRAQVIQSIETRTNTFYTYVNGRRADVGVADGPNGKGTYSHTCRRLLERQPACPPYCLIQQCSRTGQALPHQDAPVATSLCQSAPSRTWSSVASLPGSWSSLGDAGERPGACWAPGRITGRGHRRPRLYRPANLACHHWALNIPGVWGQSPQAFARSGVNQARIAANRRA